MHCNLFREICSLKSAVIRCMAGLSQPGRRSSGHVTLTGQLGSPVSKSQSTLGNPNNSPHSLVGFPRGKRTENEGGNTSIIHVI